MSPSRMWDSASSSAGRSSVLSLPLIFSSNTFRQMGSRASCCRLVFCLSVLTRTKPIRAIEGAPFRSSNVLLWVDEQYGKMNGEMNA